MSYDNSTYGLANFLNHFGKRVVDFYNHYRNLDTSYFPEDMIYYHACYIHDVIQSVDEFEAKVYKFKSAFTGSELMYGSSTSNTTIWIDVNTMESYVVFINDKKEINFYHNNQTSPDVKKFNSRRKKAYVEKHQYENDWVNLMRKQHKAIGKVLVDNHHGYDDKQQVILPFITSSSNSRVEQENFMAFETYLNLMWGSEDDRHGWRNNRLFDVGGVKEDGEPEYIWSEHIIMDTHFENNDFLLRPIILKYIDMHVRTVTDFTKWVREHVKAVVSSRSRRYGMSAPSGGDYQVTIDGFENPNGWWGETYLITIPSGFDSHNFIIEADYDQDAVDAFVDGFYGHLIIDEDANKQYENHDGTIDVSDDGDDEFANRSHGGNESKVLIEEYYVDRCSIEIV